MRFDFLSCVRTRSIPLLLCIVLLLLMLPFGLSACAGNKARDAIGAPALVLAGTGLQSDVDRGILGLAVTDRPAAQAAESAFFTAINSKDRTQIAAVLPSWPVISSLATSGVQGKVADGKLSDAAAKSFYERIANYGVVLTKVASGS